MPERLGLLDRHVRPRADVSRDVVGAVVGVDRQVLRARAPACGGEAVEREVEQGRVAKRHEHLGPRVGERAHPLTPTGGQRDAGEAHDATTRPR